MRPLAVGVSALALVTTMTGASMANTANATSTQARAQQCTISQHRAFATPGNNTDVWIVLCVQGSGNTHKAWANIDWRDGGGTRKFDNFDVQVRLERYDADHSKLSCDYTAEINGGASGFEQCGEAYSFSEQNGGYTADGLVRYDINGDGRGGFTWQLHGSPKIG